jgi:hypothetical protein
MITLHTNLKTAASAQLTGYDFNSYCRFEVHLLACGSSSLCAIGGNVGVERSANSLIETFALSLGYDGKKRVRHYYLRVETYGTLTITPFFDGVAGRPITVKPTKNGPQFIKVSGCCDEEASHITIRVENLNAAWFSLERMTVLPIYLPRGRT